MKKRLEKFGPVEPPADSMGMELGTFCSISCSAFISTQKSNTADKFRLHVDADLLEERKDARTDAEPRMDAVYLYGVDVMSTKECLQYFTDYGPSYVEWINDSSCMCDLATRLRTVFVSQSVSQHGFR